MEHRTDLLDKEIAVKFPKFLRPAFLYVRNLEFDEEPDYD